MQEQKIIYTNVFKKIIITINSDGVELGISHRESDRIPITNFLKPIVPAHALDIGCQSIAASLQSN